MNQRPIKLNNVGSEKLEENKNTSYQDIGNKLSNKQKISDRISNYKEVQSNDSDSKLINEEEKLIEHHDQL